MKVFRTWPRSGVIWGCRVGFVRAFGHDLLRSCFSDSNCGVFIVGIELCTSFVKPHSESGKLLEIVNMSKFCVLFDDSDNDID